MSGQPAQHQSHQPGSEAEMTLTAAWLHRHAPR